MRHIASPERFPYVILHVSDHIVLGHHVQEFRELNRTVSWKQTRKHRPCTTGIFKKSLAAAVIKMTETENKRLALRVVRKLEQAMVDRQYSV